MYSVLNTLQNIRTFTDKKAPQTLFRRLKSSNPPSVFFLRRTLRSETFFGNLKPFKKMKNTFYFTSVAHVVLKIFKILSRLFGHAAKQLD